MKKIFMIIMSLVILTPISLASEKKFNITSNTTITISQTTPDFKNQLTKLNVRRMLIANALSLSETQKKQSREIYKVSNEKEALLLVQIKDQKQKFKTMQSEKRNFSEKAIQHSNIKKLEKALNEIRNDSDKSFEKILTRKQKSKYHSLKKELK